MNYRNITIDEKRLLDYLVKKSHFNLPDNWDQSLQVSEMDDENMGSLRLFTSQCDVGKPSFGKRVSECHFKDSDGVDVIASLNIDSNGNIYELDLWKVNFTELKKIPLVFD